MQGVRDGDEVHGEEHPPPHQVHPRPRLGGVQDQVPRRCWAPGNDQVHLRPLLGGVQDQVPRRRWARAPGSGGPLNQSF